MEMLPNMPQKSHILTLDALSERAAAVALATLAEQGLTRPAQHAALLRTMASYLPAAFELSQRTPRGVIYATLTTPDGETHTFQVDHAGRVSYK